MKNLRPNYYDMDNWIILDTVTFKDFGDYETPFIAYKVKVGVLDVEEIAINNTYSKRSFDIIRWVSQGEYNRLRRNAGVIVW